MDNIQERLTAKLGPLPVWAWGAIVAGLALAYYLFTRKNATEPLETVSLDSDGYQTAGIKGGSGTLTQTEPETNIQWLDRVSRAVANALAASPSDVYTALSKWINGQDYTAKEKMYIDKALQLGMNPPEGTFGLGTIIDDPSNAITRPNPTVPGLRPPIAIVPRPVQPLPPKGANIPNTRLPRLPAAPAAPAAPKAPAPAPVVKGKAAPAKPAPKVPAPKVGKAIVKGKSSSSPKTSIAKGRAAV